MSNLVLFPGPFIFSYEPPRHKEIKPLIMNYVEQESPNLSNIDTPYEKQSSCTYYEGRAKFQHFLTVNGLLKDFIWDTLDACLEQLPFHIQKFPQNSRLEDVWFNHYEKGGHHKEHTHGGATFSGIYIVHCEEPNKTVFFGRGEGNQPYQHFYYTTEDVEEGTVLLFPSEVIHRVLEVETKRVVIPFNISSR